MNVINKLLLVHENGYAEFQGPFEYSVDGWMWNVTLPLDSDEYSSLSSGEEYVAKDADGWKATAFADGEVQSFGTVKSVDEFEGEDGLYMAVETPGKPD